ncbi:unnamed protein product [Pedinophyceae sp. YPF-701]|nr:unnamed protein product [Pedinophyceae sp. YPF-701]
MAEGGKHNLERAWTLWFDDQNQGGRKGANEWGSTLKPVYSFRTVEDFWCLYNNIVQPSQLGGRADIHLFKEGIQPKWEDPEFKNGDEQHGGKWTFVVKSKTMLDEHWLNTVLALIGEQFNDTEEIAGAVVSIRPKQCKLCLWTKLETNEEVQTKIGMQFKETLQLGDNDRVTYQFFADEMNNMRRDVYMT